MKDMTPQEQMYARIDFAYGNLACSTNHKPRKWAFKEMALLQCGMSETEFEVWAATKEWEA